MYEKFVNIKNREKYEDRKVVVVVVVKLLQEDNENDIIYIKKFNFLNNS